MEGLPTLTHCPYCSLQCGITLRVAPDRVHLAPQEDFPTNRGGLCSKGWNAAELLDHPQRLTEPLVRDRRDAPLVPTTWEDALDRVVHAVRRAQRTDGPDSVGCFGGGGLTNEKAYQLGKFARVALGTSQLDYNGRFCMSSAAAASIRAFGIDRGLPFPLADIAAADVVVLIGANPADTMPPAMQWFDEGRSRGATHITIDPRRSATARSSTLHLQPVPGTDLALANGLLHLAIRHGHIDTAYIAERICGFEQVRRLVRSYWPDRVERITGVVATQLAEAAWLLGEASTAMVLTARGAEQHSNGTDTTLAFINLALALGLPGRPGCGFATITGQGNGQGGREHGQKSDQLPGYRCLDDPQARQHVAAVWGVDPDSLPGSGASAYEMLYPYYLSTGRSRSHYQSGAQTRRVRALVTAEPEAYAELHPELARRVGIGRGDLVRLDNRRGSAVLRARITEDIRSDTVFVPFHWGGQAAVNALTNPALDPVSRMPEFKACAVAVSAVGPEEIACTPRRGSCRAATPLKDKAWASPSRLTLP